MVGISHTKNEKVMKIKYSQYIKDNAGLFIQISGLVLTQQNF